MIDPIILFFLLGIVAGLLKSDLRMPSQIYDFVSMILLISIGLKGGVELSKQPVTALAPMVLVVLVMGSLQTLFAYPALRVLGRFQRSDAASIAAHYGSVSVGTYAVAVAFMEKNGVYFEEYMPLLLVALEIPAIVVGILLAKGFSNKTQWPTVAHEIFAGKGVMLLFGGVVIGWLTGSDGLQPLAPLFFDLFKGMLALFLLEMGLIASSKISALRQHGIFIVLFGVAMPLFSGIVGTFLGVVLDLSVGGTAMLATLAASASYIAVPAAMRISVPDANPTLSLTASLGVTFPFNVLVGISFYYYMAVQAQAYFGG